MSDQVYQMPLSQTSPQESKGITTPHDHDVLSGRGNYVNFHAGNEHFRALVKKHKMDYVACPKPQKGKYSRMIVDEIRARDPPGRFLKQDPQTKLWYDIGDRKAVDKTRQALREGAPELLQNIKGENDGEETPPSKSNAPSNGASGYNNFSMPPPPVVVPSAGVGGYNAVVPGGMVGRVVPGMGDTTMPLNGSAVGDYQTGLQDIYQEGNFEPTPIAPNQPLRIRSSQQRSISPKRPTLERSDSLQFDGLFDKNTKDTKKSMHGSSQHMSAMSFSIGDMSEATNLSAVFHDSIRTTGGTHPDKVKSGSSPTPNDKGNEKLNMSVATFAEDELGSSMMSMSISKGFHDSVDSSDSLLYAKTESV